MCLGVLGTVTRVWDEGGVPMADVDLGDRTQVACLLYQPSVGVGAEVLIHTGFVVDALDPERAADARALRARLVAGEG